MGRGSAVNITNGLSQPITIKKSGDDVRDPNKDYQEWEDFTLKPGESRTISGYEPTVNDVADLAFVAMIDPKGSMDDDIIGRFRAHNLGVFGEIIRFQRYFKDDKDLRAFVAKRVHRDGRVQTIYEHSDGSNFDKDFYEECGRFGIARRSEVERREYYTHDSFKHIIDGAFTSFVRSEPYADYTKQGLVNGNYLWNLTISDDWFRNGYCWG